MTKRAARGSVGAAATLGGERETAAERLIALIEIGLLVATSGAPSDAHIAVYDVIGGALQAPWAPQQLPWEGEAAIAADFNLDGLADLAYLEENSYTVAVMPGQGDGTFAPAQQLSFLAAGASDSSSPVLAAVDLTGSGKLDLVSASVTPEAPPVGAYASILFNTDCR